MVCIFESSLYRHFLFVAEEKNAKELEKISETLAVFLKQVELAFCALWNRLDGKESVLKDENLKVLLKYREES